MPPRFIDASVFVHAYFLPVRALKPHEERIKEGAKAIVPLIGALSHSYHKAYSQDGILADMLLSSGSM